MKLLKILADAITFSPWDQLLTELRSQISDLRQRVRWEGETGNETRAVAFLQQALELHDLQTEALDFAMKRPLELQETAEETLSAPPLRQYVASTLFLGDCYSYLTQGRAEWLHGVTGVRLGNCFYTLERMIPLDLETQSGVRAIADQDSVFRAVRSVADSGHFLHAIFHSHRSRGIPGPSSIDEELQRRLERGGYPAIQAIFSDDGYIRFFGGKKPFEVKIYGVGAAKINERVYKLADRV